MLQQILPEQERVACKQDPVGTNEAIKLALQKQGWSTRIPIPPQQSALGLDIDYGIHGVLAEGQFSNYPFLLNNIMRANFFHKKRVLFQHIGRVDASIIVTKVHAFPASNSTLYYEQAREHMEFMRDTEVLTMPTRLMGLGADVGRPFEAIFSVYTAPRYSRTVRTRESVRCQLQSGPRANSRCRDCQTAVI